MNVIITGESACGKTTVAKILEKDYKCRRIITYTTRPKRNGEINGIDYYFISKEVFLKMNASNEFCETAQYNGWYYGTAKNDFANNDNTVIILTPHGFRQVLKNITKPEDTHIVYLNIPRRDRLIKILQRGDDIEESYSRNVSDIGQFDGIQDEVNVVINNPNYIKTPQEIVSIIISKVRESL